MKKSAKGEVVLSACQIQATRLNRIEYRRLQRDVSLLRGDLQTHIARIHRQEQGLRYHFTNVVRVIKPNRAYQAWKLAHKREIEQDQGNHSICLPEKYFLTNRTSENFL
jgi:predicted DsbA family dithiol-disulfide isomerase